MKQITKIILCALAGAAILPSCKKNLSLPDPVPADMAVLTVGLAGADATVVTRAGTDPYNYDKTVSAVQFFVFEPSGRCAGKLNSAGSINVLRGYKYTVAALANGPSVTDPTLTSLRSYSIDLKDHPYVMYGEAEADFSTAESQTVGITAASLGSRVRIVEIKNNLPAWASAITVKRVFLCNVVGTAVPSGAKQDIKYNWYGRSNIGTKITPGTDTGAVTTSDPAGSYTCADLGGSMNAGASLSGLPKYLYCFPNSSRKEMSDMHDATTTDQGASTWLSMVGTYGNKTYFWTVNLGKDITGTQGLAANYTYDVSLTVNNLGSTDPGTPTVPGSLTVSCTPKDWSNGGDVSAEI